MRAELMERARRRQKEMFDKGTDITLDQISKNLEVRDSLDSSRKESPLLLAKDAIEVDTTHMTFDEQVEYIFNLATDKIEEVNKINL
jgi:cytidylate kinase